MEPALRARRLEDAVVGERQLFADGRWQSAQVFDRVKLPIGARLTGPVIVEQMDATTVIEPGAAATVDAIGNLRIVVGQPPASPRTPPTPPTPPPPPTPPTPPTPPPPPAPPPPPPRARYQAAP